MNNYSTAPLKLYIQDIFRAQTTSDQYVYEIFGLTFKNVMLHGVITSISNVTETTANLELSDATGSVQIYYDITKCSKNVTNKVIKDLNCHYEDALRSRNENVGILSTLMEAIVKKSGIDFIEGSFISVVGDIFIDDLNTRMISAFECTVTSVERDLIWLEELRYLYEKFYLWTKK